MSSWAIAERESYLNGVTPEEFYVWLTSIGVGVIEQEWDD